MFGFVKLLNRFVKILFCVIFFLLVLDYIEILYFFENYNIWFGRRKFCNDVSINVVIFIY